MKDIVEEIKTDYAAEHGKESWKELMDWNTLTHTSLERMEKHMDEVISRVEKYYKREMTIFGSLLREMTAQLEMYQGYESKMTEEAKGLICNIDDLENTYGPHYQELIENRMRLEKLKMNVQVGNLKNLINDLKSNWNPKTRLIDGKLIHGSKSGDEINFTQFFDEYTCEWTTKEVAFRGYIILAISNKINY